MCNVPCVCVCVYVCCVRVCVCVCCVYVCCVYVCCVCVYVLHAHKVYVTATSYAHLYVVATPRLLSNQMVAAAGFPTYALQSPILKTGNVYC